jgi:hypothetical protein
LGGGAGVLPLAPREEMIALFEIVDAILCSALPFDPAIEKRGHPFELPMGNQQKTSRLEPGDRTTKELSALV